MEVSVNLLLMLLANNLPLSDCKHYRSAEELEAQLTKRKKIVHDGGWGGWGDKEVRNAARKLVQGMSQRCVAEQLAKEFNSFHPRLRMAITDIIGDPASSGNVSKGISYANELLGGRLRSIDQGGYSERRLVDRGDGLVAERRRLNPAKERAKALYAMFQRPPNYHLLSKREQKRIDQDITRARKEFKLARY